MFKKTVFIAFAISICLSINVFATPVEVGQGVNSAYLYIEWSDGFVAEFDVNFGFDVMDITTGMGLLDIVETDTSLTTVRVYDDAFIDGISYLDHSDIGYLGDENWWHYWTMESDATEWIAPWDYGATDRIVENGDCDGWIYGRATAVPEPGSIALLGLGGLALRKRKALV